MVGFYYAYHRVVLFLGDKAVKWISSRGKLVIFSCHDVFVLCFLRIEVVEQKLQTCEAKLDQIERKIRISDLSDLQLQALEKEEKELQKEKKKYETTMSQLRKENGKNTFISVVVVGVVLIIYYYLSSS